MNLQRLLGRLRRSEMLRDLMIRATSVEMSFDQPAPTLKPTTRTGSTYCPSTRSAKTCSRSVLWIGTSRKTCPLHLLASITRYIVRSGPSGTADGACSSFSTFFTCLVDPILQCATLHLHNIGWVRKITRR